MASMELCTNVFQGTGSFYKVDIRNFLYIMCNKLPQSKLQEICLHGEIGISQ